MTHFDGREDTWASFDTYTVEEFKRRSGINALTDFRPGDWDDPEFIAWVDFRIRSMTEFMAEIDKNVKSVNPGCKTIAEIYPGIGEEAARETLSPVGIYFSPKTRNYFSGVWIEAYRGIFNLLLREHIEFEIITPRTLGTAMS